MMNSFIDELVVTLVCGFWIAHNINEVPEAG